MTTTLPRAPRPTIRRARAYVPTGEVGRHLAQAKDIQARIQELTAQLDAHREWLLTHMTRLDLDRIEAGDFTVLRKIRHRWTYSPETEREMLALRTTQKWEQAQGLATDTPTIYVSFTTAPAQAGE